MGPSYLACQNFELSTGERVDIVVCEGGGNTRRVGIMEAEKRRCFQTEKVRNCGTLRSNMETGNMGDTGDLVKNSLNGVVGLETQQRRVEERT